MELTLTRFEFTDQSTIGRLEIDGKAECFVLEDVVRPGAKVFGKTAIPEGRYEIAITFSARFKRLLPLLLHVPNFDGIRIHPGNTAADTHGCLLPGRQHQANKVTESRLAFDSLFAKLRDAARREKVWITIKSQPQK